LGITVKEQLEQFVKQVKERYEDCRGNEQATKQSLIAPLFSILGYDMADPRECKPEYKADFGKGQKASTPVDWAFLSGEIFSFFVEAKEVGAKLKKYAEQLGMYFGKGQPHAKLGIYTNGLEWQFYTDLDTSNVMDKEPFLTWQVLDGEIPLDFLTILQKSQYNPQLVRAFAERKHHQSLLVAELNYLLEPSPEFIRLAVKNPDRPIETGTLTQARIEAWKPILASVIQEWAKQYTLTMALQRPVSVDDVEPAARPRRSSIQVALPDLTAAGLLKAPCPLFRKYKGHRLEADLLLDGRVRFQDTIYDSCSAAAEVARATVSGRRMNTNGWEFWQYADEAGKRHTLGEARKRFLEMKGAS
jgi:hypothetical protein